MQFNWKKWATFGVLFAALDIVVILIILLLFQSFANEFVSLLTAAIPMSTVLIIGLAFVAAQMIFSVFNWLWVGAAYDIFGLRKFLSKLGIRWTIAILAFLQILIFNFSGIMQDSIIILPIVIYLYLKAFVATKLFGRYLPF